MALSTATITFDVADLLGVDIKRIQSRVFTNVPSGSIVDTVGNKIRLGNGAVSVASDGTGSAVVWTPGTGSNPTSWQTSIEFKWVDADGRNAERTFGPFTITANADLADLVAEQEVPPTYLSTVTTQLQGYVDDAAASAQQAHDISQISTSDGVMTAVAANPASAFAVQQSAAYGPGGTAGTIGTTQGDVRYSRKTVFDVREYGALADGVHDDRPAMRAAVDAAVASIAATGRGAIVQMPAGVLLWGSGENAGAGGGALSGVGLPPALAARLMIRGTGFNTTTIKLTTSALNAFWLRRPFANGTTPATGDATASAGDYSIFQNIGLEDFTVDANNVGGTAHVLIGSIPASGAQQTRQSYANIRVQRVHGKNLPNLNTTAGASRPFVALIGTHPTALEATQTSTKNVLIEDCDVTGGSGLANVTSFGGGLVGGTNHYYDNIRFRRNRHVIPVAPVAQQPETSYYICGTGFGDSCSIEDCYSENIADDAVEIGAMQQVLLDNVRAKDPLMSLFTWRHTHAPSDTTKQVVTVRDCRAEFTAAGAAAIPAGQGGTRAYFLPISDNSQPFGSIRFERPVYISDGDSRARGQAPCPFINFDNNFLAVDIIDALTQVSNQALPGGGSYYLLNLRPSAEGSRITIRNALFRFANLTSATGGVTGTFVRLNGQNTVLDVDGIVFETSSLDLTGGGGSFNAVTIGDAASTLTGRVRGLVWRGVGSTINGGLRGLIIGPAVNLTISGELHVTDCNFKAATFATTVLQFNATSVADKVRVRSFVFPTTPPAAAIAPGASPYTYQNLDGYDEQITVSGGTVTAIDVADPTGAFVTTGLTSGSFAVRSGQRIRVTYSVVPTLIKLPQP